MNIKEIKIYQFYGGNEMAHIFKPRRGLASTNANTILASGEFFCEYGPEGIGKGPVKVKFGDGQTKYSQLPYAWGDDVAERPVSDIKEDNSTTAEEAINNISIGRTIGQIFGAIKRALTLNTNSIHDIYNNQLSNKICVTSAKLNIAVSPHSTAVFRLDKSLFGDGHVLVDGTTLREGYLRDSANIDSIDAESYLLYRLQIHPDEDECMTGRIFNPTDSMRIYVVTAVALYTYD